MCEGKTRRHSVLLLTTSGGTASLFYKGYVRFLADHDWSVFVGANMSDGALPGQVSREGGTYIEIPWTRDPNPLKDLGDLYGAWKLIRRIRPDVVVAATPKAGLLGMVASRLAGVQVRIYQQWGLRLETFAGPKRAMLFLLEKLAIASSTQCIANSRSLARRIIELRLARAGRIVVLGEGSSHGVDLDKFDQNTPTKALDTATKEFLRQSGASLTIVFIGRLHPDKGIDVLFEALRVCENEGHCYNLLLVGGDDGHVPPTESDNIHVVGAVEDVRPYLAVADVLCLPSLREGFPNVVLEAAAMEVPAIVTDATGCTDSVIDGVTGIKVSINDASALSRALNRMAADPAARRKMGRSARKRVEDNFSQPHIWQLQEDYIFRMVSSSRATPPI